MNHALKTLKVDRQCFITSYCKIKNDRIKSSNPDYDSVINLKDFSEYTKALYAQLNLNYPKFFKMDSLSKLAFLTAEILLKDLSINNFEQDKIGVVIANSFATLDTDLNYYQTIQDKNNYFPSPSLFVYTLPNIMIGEICIRHKIKGENAFFVFQEFNHNFINKYVLNLFNTGKINCCITGWIDYTQNDYEAILFLVEAKQTGVHQIAYNSENTKKIYSA